MSALNQSDPAPSAPPPLHIVNLPLTVSAPVSAELVPLSISRPILHSCPHFTGFFWFLFCTTSVHKLSLTPERVVFHPLNPFLAVQRCTLCCTLFARCTDSSMGIPPGPVSDTLVFSTTGIFCLFTNMQSFNWYFVQFSITKFLRKKDKCCRFKSSLCWWLLFLHSRLKADDALRRSFSKSWKEFHIPLYDGTLGSL